MDGLLHTPPPPIYYQNQDATDEEPPPTPSPQSQPSNKDFEDEDRDENVISHHRSRSSSPESNKDPIATSPSLSNRSPSPPMSRSSSPSDSILDQKDTDESEDDSDKPSKDKKKKDKKKKETDHLYSKIPQSVQDISEESLEEYLEKLKNLVERKMSILRKEHTDKGKEIILAREDINAKKKELKESEKIASKELHEQLKTEAAKYKTKRGELRKKKNDEVNEIVSRCKTEMSKIETEQQDTANSITSKWQEKRKNIIDKQEKKIKKMTEKLNQQIAQRKSIRTEMDTISKKVTPFDAKEKTTAPPTTDPTEDTEDDLDMTDQGHRKIIERKNSTETEIDDRRQEKSWKRKQAETKEQIDILLDKLNLHTACPKFDLGNINQNKKMSFLQQYLEKTESMDEQDDLQIGTIKRVVAIKGLPNRWFQINTLRKFKDEQQKLQGIKLERAKKTLVNKAVAEMLYGTLQRLSSDYKEDFENFDNVTEGARIRNKIMNTLKEINNNWSYKELFGLDVIVQLRSATSPHPWPAPLEIAPIVKKGDMDLLKKFMLQYTAEKNQVLVDHYANSHQQNKEQPTFIKIKKIYEIFLKTKPSIQIDTEKLEANSTYSYKVGTYTYQAVCCMPFTRDSRMLRIIQEQHNEDLGHEGKILWRTVMAKAKNIHTPSPRENCSQQRYSHTPSPRPTNTTATFIRTVHNYSRKREDGEPKEKRRRI